MPTDPTIHLRYERKYLSYDHNAAELRHLLLCNPSFFSPIFYRRQVNSLYFDNPEFEYFQQNTEGDFDRMKVRVRWYGTAEPKKLQLELKIKHGEVMQKQTYSLESSQIGDVFLRQPKKFIAQVTAYIRTTLQAALPEAQELQPVLFNTYQREYFYSALTRIRVTIDEQVRFQTPQQWAEKRTAVTSDVPILECKYAIADDRHLKQTIQALPLNVAKSSKYVVGVQQLYPNLVAA